MQLHQNKSYNKFKKFKLYAMDYIAMDLAVTARSLKIFLGLLGFRKEAKEAKEAKEDKLLVLMIFS